MDIGVKIKQLRENRKMSQHVLASELGISQTTLHNIETGNHHKIDFMLMDKICHIFDKDFPYFANDSVINNNIKEITGQGQQINCENVTVNNHYPESILVEIQNLINENKLLKAKIAELEKGR
jgi:transcriptional regulator with XRE-family HTH domain